MDEFTPGELAELQFDVWLWRDERPQTLVRINEPVIVVSKGFYKLFPDYYETPQRFVLVVTRAGIGMIVSLALTKISPGEIK